MNQIKLIVLGASGRCGSWVVRLAKERGHDVTAIVRDESNYVPPADVPIVRGQVTDPEFVRSIIADHGIIISCLGLRRANLTPWGKLLSPPNLIESVTKHLTDCMQKSKEYRFIWISAGGVGSSQMQLSSLVRRMVSLGNIRIAYKDLENAERIIEHTDINSLAVRPVTLVPGAPTGKVGTTNRYTLLSVVRRGDLAQWMLNAAESEQLYENKSVLLGRAKTMEVLSR